MELKKNPGAELGRYSNLFFLIGLNIMLFVTWRLLELKSFTQDEITIESVAMADELDEDIPIVEMKDLPPPPPPPVAPSVIAVVADELEVEETVIESSETSSEDVIADVVDVDAVEVAEVEEDVEVAFAVIEDVPIYPGCEGLSKQGKRECFNQKVQKHIQKNFRYPVTAQELGIQGRVFVRFVIDAKGKVTNVQMRGPDPTLEKEAQRIIDLLPTMIPGKQRGRAVKVPYSIPITFKLADRT
ncbi:energy transducer TonB [Sungkyunkwania multivorans]|uniref:Energy transducer TonB n=1 Tax=Sungkyunkwania multivorans TaxID=1173618 RepID=A0ABW3CYL7_9FLAO